MAADPLAALAYHRGARKRRDARPYGSAGPGRSAWRRRDTVPRTGSFRTVLAQRTQQPQREQPDERCPTAQVLLVLVVEGPCIAPGILGCRISFGAPRPASARTVPAHRVALAEEAEAMSEKAAAQHRDPPYAESGVPARPPAPPLNC